MPISKKIPQRMCIVCKQMQPKKELVRIVKNSSGEIKVDITGKSPGRGTYICKSAECATKLVKSKSLHKAYNSQVSNETYDNVVSEIQKILRGEIIE